MLIFWAVAAYLLGSVPFGVLVARAWNVDIRRRGSGNIGATNVFRTLGPLPGALVFLLDFLKGVLAVYIGYWVGGDPMVVLLMSAAVILGHMFPVFLRFRGGKGAATGLGVLFGLAPDIFFIGFLLAGVIIYTTRYVSVATLATSLAITLMMFSFHRPLPYCLLTLVVTIFIWWRHLPNIKRLRQGTELKV
ncbi:MAG: glycerol-3-phosphate 1-O-acyltransferase PlsY [Candidatus Margulisiibacteriota bacterium]